MTWDIPPGDEMFDSHHRSDVAPNDQHPDCTQHYGNQTYPCSCAALWHDDADRLAAALRDIEWQCSPDYNDRWCPSCGGSEPRHLDGCMLTSALRPHEQVTSK